MTTETVTLLFVVNAALLMVAARATESLLFVAASAAANAYLLSLIHI